jgi:hypothetical protein
MAVRADEMINYDSPVDLNNSPIIEEDNTSWQLSIIAGGFSKHLTTKYEPADGYTEQHSNLGLELGQAGPGWVLSAQATWFTDSHDENSFLAVGAFGYRAVMPYQFFIYGGIGVGYTETSYYSGVIALPYAELGWWRISAQGSYLPEVPDADSGIAVQFKFKIAEWQ